MAALTTTTTPLITWRTTINTKDWRRRILARKIISSYSFLKISITKICDKVIQPRERQMLHTIFQISRLLPSHSRLRRELITIGRRKASSSMDHRHRSARSVCTSTKTIRRRAPLLPMLTSILMFQLI